MLAPRPATHAAFLAAERYPSLDGLRCLAILPVVWHHSTPRPLSGVLGRGPLGVDLFFALSGFLITTLLVRERARTGTLSLRRFWARRALRIFPLYYAVLAFTLLRALFLLPRTPLRQDFLHDAPYYATFTANVLADFSVPHPVIFGFAWSLSTEEQFYLLWPPLLWLLGGFRTPSLVLGGLLILDQAAERGMLTPLLGHGVALRAVTSIAAPLCLGALLALALSTPVGFRRVAAVLGRPLSAPLCLGALALLVLSDGAPLFAVHVAMVALVGALSVRADHGARRLFEAGPVVFVGTVSYGVYLLHVGMITLTKTALPAFRDDAPVVFAVALPLSLVAAALSHRYLERPFSRIGARFR